MVAPVIPCNSSVGLFVAEGAKELDEDVVHGAITWFNGWMVGASENLSELIGNNGTSSVAVELLEGSLDGGATSLTWVSPNSNEEFSVVNVSIFAGVKVVQQKAGLTLGEGRSEVLQAPVELLFVNKSVLVNIHNSEGAAKGAHNILLFKKLSTNLLQNYTASSMSVAVTYSQLGYQVPS